MYYVNSTFLPYTEHIVRNLNQYLVSHSYFYSNPIFVLCHYFTLNVNTMSAVSVLFVLTLTLYERYCQTPLQLAIPTQLQLV